MRWALALGPLVLLALAEGLGRAVAPFPARLYVWKPSQQWVLNPDPEFLPGISGRAVFATNELGLRGRARPTEQSAFLAVVGGSTSECLYLDQGEAWPAITEARLLESGHPVWVVNSGRSGHSSRHHRLVVDMLLADAHKPDLVILMAGINDFLRRLSNDSAYDPLAFDKSHLRPQLEYESFLLIPKGQGLLEPDYKTTGVWRLLRSLRSQVSPAPTKQDDTGANYEHWRRLRRNPGRVRDVVPDLDAALGEFRNNLVAIHASCERAGVRLMLVTQAYAWRKDMPAADQALCWMGGVGNYTSEERCDYYSIEALAEGQARYNQVVLHVAMERGIDCLNLEAKVPKDRRYFYDDVHLSEAGCRLAGGAVADFLAERPGLLKPAAR